MKISNFKFIALVLLFLLSPQIESVLHTENTALADPGQYSVDIDYIVDPTGWLTGWSYRKAITIDNSNVDADLSNFPLYVKIDNDSDLGDNARADGYDVRFTTDDGSTLLPYEIESWAGGGAVTPADANIWVKVPTVTTAADTTIYLYYGNASATTDWTAATSTLSNCTSITNAQCVWKEGATQSFAGVWHLNETAVDEATTADLHLDSTSNNNDGDQTGNTNATGKISNAQDFDGTDDYVGTSSSSNSMAALSAAFWVKFDDFDNTYTATIAQTISGAPNTGGWLGGYYNSGVFRVWARSNGVDFVSSENSGFVPSLSTWYHLTTTWDSAGDGKLRLYVNGVLQYTSTGLSNFSMTNLPNLVIGALQWANSNQNSVFTNQLLDGLLDDIRVSSSARGAEWIEFEYCNMTNSATAACGASNNYEISFGAEDAITGGNFVWTNGSGDGLWSTAGNWQGGVAPGTSNTAIFNGAATGNATIGANISIAGIDIQSGYTGTITQSGSYTITVGASGWTQAAGTFTGGSGNISISTSGSFALSGGTFTATSGTTTFSYRFTHTAGGTFSHNNGTVVFSGAGITHDVNVSETFNNVIVNKNNGVYLALASGDTYIVNGTLTLTDGYIDGGTINAKGSISIASTFDGGTSNILIDGAGDQSFTILNGSDIPGITLNNSLTTIDFEEGANVTMEGNFTLQAGVFTAPTGTLTFQTYFIHTAGGTFSHNNGTVVFSGSGYTQNINVTETFNNIIVNKDNGQYLAIVSGDTFIANGTVTLTDGVIDTGTIQAQGDVTIASTFDGGTGILQFTGGNNQTYTDSGGVVPTGTYTVNKSGGILTLGSNLALATAGQDFTITEGTVDLAGYNLTLTSAGDVLTIDDGATLKLQGDETITATTKTLNSGSTVEYTATSGTRDIKNWTYTNATLKINGTGGTFTLPANTTATAVEVDAGTLALAGYNLTSSSITVSDRLTLQGGETISSAPTLTGSTVTYNGTSGPYTINDWTYNNLTISGAGATFNLSATETVSNASVTAGTLGLGAYNLNVSGNWTGGGTVTGSGAVALTGSSPSVSGSTTFNNLTFTAPQTVTFTAGTTQTFNGTLSCSGSSGNIITLASSAASVFNLSKSSGTVDCDYISVSYSAAAGGATWNPGSHSTNGGNNTGWDTTDPSTTVSFTREETSQNNITATLTCSDGSGFGCGTTYYCYDTTNECTPTTTYTSAVTLSISHNTYFRYYSVDSVSNSETTRSEGLLLMGGSGGPSFAPPFGGATEGQGQEEPAETPSPSVIEQVAEQVKEIIKVLTPQKEEEITYPPIAESVPEEAPEALKGGWTLIPSKGFQEFVLTPLSQEIKDLAVKFPKFRTTLSSVGMLDKITDIYELKASQLTFPGLSEILGSSAVGTPVSKLPYLQQKEIPTDIVFVRTAEEKIDFNIKVSISNLGKPIQSINTITNTPLTLVVKPDKPAESVKGYLIFNSRDTGPIALSASIADSIKLAAGQNAPKDLVLKEFDYIEQEGTGIWKADITSPVVEGKYEVRTVITYKDKTEKPEELKMLAVVDPEGYIYKKTSAGEEARIKGAVVSLYWLNSKTEKYELWPAGDYQQENSQKTDATGKYSFLSPAGTYYLKVEALSYASYQSEPFELRDGAGIHMNIEMQSSNWSEKFFSIKTIIFLLVAMIFLLLAVVVTCIYIILRRKIGFIT